MACGVVKAGQQQIRVSPRDKRRIAGGRQALMPVSAWVRGRPLPAEETTFQHLCSRLAGKPDAAFVHVEPNS